MLVSATVATTTAFAVAAASATAVTHVGNQVLNLLSRSVAILQHLSFKLQCLTSQGVVRVQCHAVGLHLGHLSHKVLTLFVLHGDHGTLIDVSAVKLTIDLEVFATHFVHALLIIFAKGLGRCQREVELLALFQLRDLLLKAVQREAETCDKLEGTVLLCFLHQLLLSVLVDGVELVVH